LVCKRREVVLVLGAGDAGSIRHGKRAVVARSLALSKTASRFILVVAAARSAGCLELEGAVMSQSPPASETAREAPSLDLTGRRLGDYQVLRRLGRGGMAEV
jgi:hypothetical protein